MYFETHFYWKAISQFGHLFLFHTSKLQDNFKIMSSSKASIICEHLSQDVYGKFDVPCIRSKFLGGLSLQLNHLIASRMGICYQQFGTLPIGIFLSNLDSRQLDTSLMTSYGHL